MGATRVTKQTENPLTFSFPRLFPFINCWNNHLLLILFSFFYLIPLCKLLSTFSSSPPLHQLRLDPRILFGLGNFSSASSHHKRIHPSIRYLCLAFFLYPPLSSPHAPKPTLTSRQAVEPPSCLALSGDGRLKIPPAPIHRSQARLQASNALNPPRGPPSPCRALHPTTASLRRNSNGIRLIPHLIRPRITPMNSPRGITSIHHRLPLPSLPSRGARTFHTRPRCPAVYRRP